MKNLLFKFRLCIIWTVKTSRNGCNGNTYLIIFRARPLRTNRLGPFMLSLLEAPVEGFFWNLPEFGCRIRFHVLHGCGMCPLEAHFQSGEQPKGACSEIRTVRWLGDDRIALLGEELLHKPYVARCVLVMQKPLSLPLVESLPPNCTSTLALEFS
jgi:hypothetical protein